MCRAVCAAVCMILFVAASSDELEDNFNTSKPHDCAKKSIAVYNNGTFGEDIARTGRIYRVVGITSNCYVFYGWLHDVLNEKLERRNKTQTGGRKKDKTCKNKAIMLVRTEGVNQRMLLVIDRYGRRVRVLSAFSGKLAGERSDLVWRELFNHRREASYTSPIDQGYIIQNFINANYRIFVVASNHVNVRIYELRVFVDDDFNMVPYLRDEHIDVPQMVVTPFLGIFTRAVHDLVTSAPKAAQYLAEAEDSKAMATGLVFLRGDQVTNADSIFGPALPIISMLAKSFRGTNPTYKYDHFFYKEKSGSFSAKFTPECAEVLNNVMIYTHDISGEVLEYAESTVEERKNRRYVPTEPIESGFTFSQRRWFNIKHFHKRMSYPHTIHRMEDRNILSKGWKELAPVFFATIGAILLVSIVVNFIVNVRERRARRLGRSTSFSTTTA